MLHAQQAISRFRPRAGVGNPNWNKTFYESGSKWLHPDRADQCKKGKSGGLLSIEMVQYIDLTSGDTIKLAAIKLKDVTDGLSSQLLFSVKSRWECSNQARLELGTF